LDGLTSAQAIFSLALPYPVYLLSEQLLHAFGVVSVVCAGLTNGWRASVARPGLGNGHPK
jgi:CPA1 family monovalent cation:H+ antiporter